MMSSRRTSGLWQRQVWAIGLALCSVFGCAGLVGATAFAALPDGRVYEAVSPVAEAVSPVAATSNAGAYIPSAGIAYLGANNEHGIFTTRPFQAAPDGEAVTYAGDPAQTGGGGSSGQTNGDSWLSRRSAEGWSAVDIQPTTPEPTTKYVAFTSDLSIGILSSGEALTPDAPPAFYESVYEHSTLNGVSGEYAPLFTGTPTERSAGEFNTEAYYGGANAGTSDVPTASHVLFGADEAFLVGEGPLQTELKEQIVKNREEGNMHEALYDYSGGKRYLVSVLPGGKADAHATFGAKQGQRNSISADGARIFWTALGEGEEESEGELIPTIEGIYVRENEGTSTAKTVQVDGAVGGGGRFVTASADGGKAFFTKDGDLYRYNLETSQTTDLTPGGEVKGVLGASEDGSYIYFAAGAALAAGATVQSCEPLSQLSEGTPCNVYVWHEGTITFIAALAGADNNEVHPFDGQSEGNARGDWRSAVANRTAYVTPDGRNLAFMSRASLTGYDNVFHGEPLDEVFLYEADPGTLRCVSCNPSGAAPVSTHFHNGNEEELPVGAFIPIGGSGSAPGYTYQARVVADGGGRVFFDSGEPLVPEDNNGLLDVYEWEREGVGSCRQSQGCVYLLSRGSSPDSSYLLDASASGDDVFMITRAQLVAADRNEDEDVYDARVGGVQPPASPACSGTGCQGAPPAPPIFATPSSATFIGVGNFPPPPSRPVAGKPKSKPKAKVVRCKKGFIKRHGRCVKKKAKRAASGRGKQHV